MKARCPNGDWIALGTLLLLVAGTVLPGLTSAAAGEDTAAQVKPL